MLARGVDVARERKSAHDLPLVFRDVDGRVGVTAHRAEVPPLLRDAAPLRGRQKPRALLAADLARELDESLRVTRLGRPDPGHGTTTP